MIMKKLLFTLLLMTVSIVVFGQLTVNSSGAVKIGTISQASNTFLSVGNNTSSTGGVNNGIISRINAPSFGNSNINIGVHSRVNGSSNSKNVGVAGIVDSGSSGNNVGVQGNISSGVYGVGVYGLAIGYSGAYVPSSGRYAGYFVGPTYVSGTLTAADVVTPSDINLKENVIPISDEELVNGSTLDNVMNMNVIKYKYKVRSRRDEFEDNDIQDAIEENAESRRIREESEKRSRQFDEQKHYGLSAQELQKIYPDLVREGQDGFLGINYIELVPVLIRSIQELKQELDEVRGDKEVAMTRGAATALSSTALSGNVLYQNSPNPFKEQTVIRFRLADDARDAAICIFDMTGKLLKKLPVSQGETSVSVNGWELGEGIFLYTLMVNGREIDTKRMIITK